MSDEICMSRVRLLGCSKRDEVLFFVAGGGCIELGADHNEFVLDADGIASEECDCGADTQIFGASQFA